MALRTGEHGVKAADLAAQRAALLARCDQRAKGEQYVRGLLLEGRRKGLSKNNCAIFSDRVVALPARVGRV
jgi:hypothetical protein